MTGREDQDPNRAERFRHEHRVGELVRGRILGRDPSGLSWVEIQGHRLLAGIGSRAAPGEQHVFRVLELYPAIVLQDITGLSAASFDVRKVLHSFRSARDRLETGLDDLAADAPLFPAFSKAGGAEALRSAARRIRSLPLYRDVRLYLNLLNRLVSPTQARVIFLPWLLPEGRQQEGMLSGKLFREGGRFQLEYGAAIGRSRGGVLKAWGDEEGISCRLYVEGSSSAEHLKERILFRLNGVFQRPVRFLGCAQMPADMTLAVCNRLVDPLLSRGADVDFRV